MNAQTQVSTITEAPRRSLLIDMATRYGMEPKTFADTLRATVVPRETSNEEFAAFLMVAKEYELNPLLKEIYAFPKRGGGIQPIVSIDGWCNLINSHPMLNGIEFDDHLDKDGKVTSITARIWRKDREKPIVVTEYMVECVRPTDTWKQYPRRMLRHKALIQCARYAFGFAGIVDPDEAERMGAADVSATRDITPRDDGPPAPPPRQIDHKPATAARPSDLELVEAGRDDGRQVEWGEHSETPSPSTAPASDEIPPMLDRRPKPVADPEFANWRKDAEGALAGCEGGTDLGDVYEKVIKPGKGKVSTEDWQAVAAIYKSTFDRISMAE